MMLSECSKVGAAIDVDRVPRPDGVPLERWLQTFPSFGFLVAAERANAAAVVARFRDRGIAAADIGAFTADRRVTIVAGAAAETIWDFSREALLGCVKSEVFA